MHGLDVVAWMSLPWQVRFILLFMMKGISLRLLALILCSNCSNTFNKVLTTIGGHMLNYFLKPEGSLELAQYPSRMVEAFHCRHDLCTPPHLH